LDKSFVKKRVEDGHGKNLFGQKSLLRKELKMNTVRTCWTKVLVKERVKDGHGKNLFGQKSLIS
jgi:hypothetical protein